MRRAVLVTPELRTRARGLGTPVALALGRLGLTPNALTVIGFAISVAAAVAAANTAWLAAGFLVIFGGVFDLFDGSLARATGKAGPVGAFLDSTFDRAGEGIVLLGIAAGSLALGIEGPVLLAFAASLASFMVSYTRARAESLGFDTGAGMAAVGLAPREVRLVILTIGLVIAGLVATEPPTGGAGGMAEPLDVLVLELALGLIALLATLTTIQRVLHSIRRGHRQASPSGDVGATR